MQRTWMMSLKDLKQWQKKAEQKQIQWLFLDQSEKWSLKKSCQHEIWTVRTIKRQSQHPLNWKEAVWVTNWYKVLNCNSDELLKAENLLEAIDLRLSFIVLYFISTCPIMITETWKVLLVLAMRGILWNTFILFSIIKVYSPKEKILWDFITPLRKAFHPCQSTLDFLIHLTEKNKAAPQ